MGMSVLVIDGPSRGEVYRLTKGNHFIVANFRPITVGYDPDDETVADQIVYHIHRFAILRRIILIASVRLTIDEASEDEAFNLIVSEKAKAAAYVD